MFGYTIIRNQNFTTALTGLAASTLDMIEDGLVAALEIWGRYIEAPNANIEIDLAIEELAGNGLAEAGPFYYSQGGGPFIDIVNQELSSDMDVDINILPRDASVIVDLSTLRDGDFYFDTTYEPNPSGLGFSQSDFLTVMLHELAHVFGFISTPSFSTNYSDLVIEIGGQHFFTGANAVAEFGGNVPIDSASFIVDGSIVTIGDAHFDEDSVLGDDVLSPVLTTGTRAPVTPLGVAVLQDLGVPIVSATAAADTLYGYDEYDDDLNGLDGDDTLIGLSGNDTLRGGLGGDMVDGGEGNDSLHGDAGNDSLRGGLGDDVIKGGGENDNLRGEAGDDTLNGDAGNDIVDGGNGDDSINGGGGEDTLRGNGGVDTINGNAGDDAISAGIGNDTAFGGSGNDTLLGQGDNDELHGNAGLDMLRGGSGDDTLFGGEGDDMLFGQGNNDILHGEGGNDALSGAAGSDQLFGGAGDDTLNGSVGADRLDGGSGNDVLNGGNMDGARDTFVFAVGYDEDRINSFDQAGNDRLELDDALWAGVGTLTAQQVVDMFGSLNGSGTILTLDFGNGDILEVQSAAGIDADTLGEDILIV